MEFSQGSSRPPTLAGTEGSSGHLDEEEETSWHMGPSLFKGPLAGTIS